MDKVQIAKKVAEKLAVEAATVKVSDYAQESWVDPTTGTEYILYAGQTPPAGATKKWSQAVYNVTIVTPQS